MRKKSQKENSECECEFEYMVAVVVRVGMGEVVGGFGEYSTQIGIYIRGEYWYGGYSLL